ncbi:pyridine nucleotide-disulfide oxidoreductase [Actinomyces sp. B33]|uniref:pyridine nucleotide-disulfide oxidoreductase n=1 Tax=Actinomyces sp. B33 TaxID=2942131 RepID=UPI0023418D0E|nr:pyridine nucleotide-disulfide oxidoreductase [Actinomyces sp. B33]MDC4232343.1 pyridine nucleotide-disulfide oxidoreductase [Actinomyces sp. B33]
MSEQPGTGQWREVRRWMHAATPVNKTVPTSSAWQQRLPQIANPLVIGALGIGAIGAGVALRALKPARRPGRSDRFRTLVLAAIDGLSDRPDPRQSAGADWSDRPGPAPAQRREVGVDVGEGFGKPSLVTADIILPADDPLLDDGGAAGILDRATRAIWDNREIAPVAVRARVLVPLAPDDDATARSEPSARTRMDDATAGDVDEEAPTLADARADARAPGVGDDLPDSPPPRRTPDAAPPPSRELRLVADMTALGFDDETARPVDLYERYGAPASDPAWKP